MSEFEWCNLETGDWDTLSVDQWETLPVCLDQAYDYYYDGPVPSAIRQDREASRFMRDYPIDATAPVAAKSPNSVTYESGEFCFAKELLSVPSVGDFRWVFGISHQQNNDADDMLGPGWLSPQYEHLELGWNGYANEVAADRPLAYWGLGDTVLPQARDIKGLANGTYIGSPQLLWGAIPSGGHGVFFNNQPGQGQYVNINPTPAELDLRPTSHSFSIEAWVKLGHADGSDNTVISKGNHQSAQYLISFKSFGNIKTTFYGQVGTATIEQDVTDSSLTVGWNHVVLVNRYYEREDGQAGFEFNLFVNGVAAKDWKPSVPVSNAAPVRIAAETGASGGASGFLRGGLDEIAIYDHALSDNNILSHYLAGTTSGANPRVIRKVTSQQTAQMYVDRNDNGVFYGQGGEIHHLPGTTVADAYVLYAADGTRTSFTGFNSHNTVLGRMTAVRDRFGRTQSYTWANAYGNNKRPLLTSVTDPLGRIFYYEYTQSGVKRLSRITCVSPSLTLDFQYNDAGRLTAVMLPPITQAADGNVFPLGTAYAFRYDADGRVTDVFSPQQTAPHLAAAAAGRSVQLGGLDQTSGYLHASYYDATSNDARRGRVQSETVGGNGVGGTYHFDYEIVPETDPDSTPFWAPGQRVRRRTTVTDPNGNVTQHHFSGERLTLRTDQQANRAKLPLSDGPSLSPQTQTTYYAHNDRKQPRLVILPERNSVEYYYDSGKIADNGVTLDFPLRAGLLTREVRRSDNRYGQLAADLLHPVRDFGDFPALTRVMEYEPVFNQLCVLHDLAGEPTLYYYDYQQLDPDAIAAKFAAALDTSAATIKTLIQRTQQRLATGSSPGSSFQTGLSDINQVSLESASRPLGALVKVRHPMDRIELFGVNLRGQTVTRTDAMGNVSAIVRHPEQDPTGSGQPTNTDLSPGQFGWIKAEYHDVAPQDVAGLTGLEDFTPILSRDESEGEYCRTATFFPRYNAFGQPLEIHTQDPDLPGDQTKRRITLFDRTELGEPYRVTSPQPYAFVQEYRFDANRNMVRHDTEDRIVYTTETDEFAPDVPSTSVANVPMSAGPGGSIRPGWFVTSYEYDLLDQPTVEHVEATGSTPADLITTYVHDANGNLTTVNRIDSAQTRTVEYDYDERNLRIAERVGGLCPTVYGFDGNGNLRHIIGPEDRDGASATNGKAIIATAFGGSTSLEHTGDWLIEHVYDGQDRLLRTIDAVGNVVEYDYDGRGNVLEERRLGPTGGQSPTNRSPSANLLAKTRYEYDEADRRFKITQVFTPDETKSLNTDLEFDLADRVIKTTGPNGAISTRIYDGLGRVTSETDALNNVTASSYDAAGNLTQILRTDVADPDSESSATDTFISRFRYDALGKLVIQSHQGADGADPVDLSISTGLHTLIGYDSRGNRTHQMSPNGTVITQTFDGANRLLATTEAVEDGSRTTTRQLDASGMVTLLTDANGKSTAFKYDTSGRLVKTTYAYDTDTSSKHVRTYDSAGLTSYTDGNLLTGTYSYDAIGRPTMLSIAPAGIPQADPIITQKWEYDGLSRITLAFDQDAKDGGIGDGSVRYTYDSLGQLTAETIGDWTTGHSDYEAGAPKALTFPNGRQLNWSYDLLQRPTRVTSPTTKKAIASWHHIGTDRLLGTTMGNKVKVVYGHEDLSVTTPQSGNTPEWGDPCDERFGYDGAGRIISKRYIGQCPDKPAGDELYTTHQTVAQNVDGWDYVQAHGPIPDGISSQGTNGGYQYTHRQKTTSNQTAWTPLHVHSGSTTTPCTDPVACTQQHMVEQVTGVDHTNFDFVRSAKLDTSEESGSANP